MSLALLALACGFAALAAAVVARDAARRGSPWLQAGTAAGCVVLFGCSVLVLYVDPLATRYALVTGRPGSALSPRELVGLFAGAAAVLTVTVLAAYGALIRTRRPA